MAKWARMGKKERKKEVRGNPQVVSNTPGVF